MLTGVSVLAFVAAAPGSTDEWVKYCNDPAPNADAGTGSTSGRVGRGTSASMGDYTHAHTPWVIKDGSVYRMWYSGYDNSSQYRIYSATSTDALVWYKVANALPTWRADAGVPMTNVIVLGGAGKGDLWHALAPSVVKDGPSSYKMWYTGYNTTDTKNRIFCATSSDARIWYKVDNSILPRSDNLCT
jgi:predicted GH43/DUF377 family glycosyl hydrolase